MKRMSRCGAVRAEILCKPHAFDSAHRQETRAQRRSARAKIAWNTARRCDRIEEREEFVRMMLTSLYTNLDQQNLN